MEDEVTLTGDEAVLASRIKTIDRELDALEQRTQDSVILGLHGSGAAMMTNMAQTSADKQKTALLVERVNLVNKIESEGRGQLDRRFGAAQKTGSRRAV